MPALDIPDELKQLGLSPTAIVAIGIAVVAVLVMISLPSVRRRKRRVRLEEPSLEIDLLALPQTGPSPTGPQLRLYHVPVRVAVVIMARAGRGSDPPPESSMPELLDEILPGLSQVLALHQPVYCGWPGQLSSEGFAKSFFTNVRLPGDHGRRTIWCGVAGRGIADGQKYLVGLALCAAKPNPFGQIVIERDFDWLDALRVND